MSSGKQYHTANIACLKILSEPCVAKIYTVSPYSYIFVCMNMCIQLLSAMIYILSKTQVALFCIMKWSECFWKNGWILKALKQWGISLRDKNTLQYHGTWESRVSLVSLCIPYLTVNRKLETSSSTLQQCYSDILVIRFRSLADVRKMTDSFLMQNLWKERKHL